MDSSYDLHTHSTASDGTYTPSELVREAAASGITHLALSDHDSLDGLSEAAAAAFAVGIQLIPSVEISVTWNKKAIHIVGLSIDPDNVKLQDSLKRLQSTRLERAKEMGRRLAKYGVPGAFEAASEMTQGGMITRTHFARYLVQQGLAATVKDVFDRFLVHGKPGYVATEWAGLEDCISWIKEAGGIAVLAHPQRYKLTVSWMHRLLSEFRECGGEAMEVISGSGSPNEIQSAADRARRFGLLASCGSDFHSPEFQWPKLGRLPPLPTDLSPVWSAWT